LNNYKISY